MDQPGLEWIKNLPPWDGNNFTPLGVAKEILFHLGNPQDQYPTIHIAGTNGKGTVASILNHVFVKSNKFNCVGLMTSPHLEIINERCQIDSKIINDAELSSALLDVEKVCRKLAISPTYFVAITSAIFKIFADKNVSIAIIEVGLGGRNDATNLISRPKLTVITSIGFDHQEQLGNAISEIALNKAGIIKENVDLVLGPVPKDAKEVILAEALQKQSNVFEGASDFNLANNIFLPEFLQQNLAVALRCLQSFGFNSNHAISYLQGYSWPRRFNIWKSHKQEGSNVVILDGAHNVDGVAALLQGVRSYNEKELGYLKIKLLFTFLSRKNWQLSIEPIINFIKVVGFDRIELMPFSLSAEFVSNNEYQENFGNIIPNMDISTLEQLKKQFDPSNKSQEILICFGSLKIPPEIENILRCYNYQLSTLL